MELQAHSMHALFEQLGLEQSDAAIESFINRNKPIPGDMELHEAGFWNASQASFLKQAKQEDADWVELVDQLDVMLR